MDFLKKFIKVDRNASTMEKFVTYAAPIGAILLLIYLYGSLLGIFNNFLSQAADKAPNWSVVLGFVFTVVAAFWAWWNWSDNIPFRINETAASWILFVLVALSIAFFCGWWVGDYKDEVKVKTESASGLARHPGHAYEYRR